MIKKGLFRLGIFFLYLISLLPFLILYLIADFLFVILYYVIGYRRKVVQENLRNAFPNKTEQESSHIEKEYYKYLADLIVETVKMISISNPLFIIYKPLSNTLFDEFFKKVRGKFGGKPISMKQTLRTMIQHKDELTVTVFAGDQTPVREDTNYFTDFLNQPTAVFLGIEKIAKLIDSVVIFYDMRRVKRGHYSYTIVPLVENAKETAPYEITNAHVKYLETMINREPQYWLWSHRRWKFKPEDIH